MTSEDTRNTVMVEQTPWNSLWYIDYVLNGDRMDKNQLKEFRSRYRLPYENFKELLQELGNHADFAKWTPGRTNNEKKFLSSISVITWSLTVFRKRRMFQ